MKHLVFYDGQCGLCDRAVQWILDKDKQKIFVFAPLQGVTAAKLLANLPLNQRQLDTLILIENYQTTKEKMFMLGEGALRICWLLGGFWSILGVLSFFPGWLYNWCYRIVAANRRSIFDNDTCKLPTKESGGRFLP